MTEEEREQFNTLKDRVEALSIIVNVLRDKFDKHQHRTMKVELVTNDGASHVLYQGGHVTTPPLEAEEKLDAGFNRESPRAN